MKIQTKKTSTNYVLTDGKYVLEARAHSSGGVSLFSMFSPDSPKAFIFEETRPEVIEALAKLFIEASKIKL